MLCSLESMKEFWNLSIKKAREENVSYTYVLFQEW